MAELSNEERLRRFYNFLGSESVGMKNLPDFTTFSRKMQDADRREQLYEGLKTQKHIKNLPDNFDSFNKLIGMSIPLNPIPQNENGNEVMDINGVSRMDYSSPSIAQPKQEEVQQAAVASQQQNVAEAQQQPVDTTSAVVAPPTSAPTVQEPVQQQTTPVTEQIVNTPKVTTPSVPSDFTPYDQRMAEQTKPIQDLMRESRDADLTAQANAAEWSARENDLNNNFKQFNDAQEKLNGEYVDFQAKVNEFNSKYPKDWQPKNNSEYTQYQKDREVVESLQNLLNAKQDALNEELGKLGKEADVVGKHYNDVANSSTYIAQKLEGNVSGLLNSVKEEIANSTTYMNGNVRTDGKQAVTVGYAGAPKVKQEQNKVEEFGYRVAERILQRTQNQINEYHAEKEDEATTVKWGKNVPWLGTVAGNVADYMKGYFRGEIDAIKDGAGFDFGIKDAVEMKCLYDAVQKSDRIDEIAKKKANGEKLSNEEKALFDSGLSNSERAILDAAAMEVVAASMYKTGFGYTGGQVGVDMIPFMLEIAINPLALVGKSVGSAVTRYAFKKFGAKAAKHGMLRGVAFTARTLAGATVGGTGMAVTTGAGKTFADYNRRKTGQIKYGLDDYGNLVFGGHEEGMSSGKAAVTAIASQSLEYSTENFSEIMRGVGRVTGANKFLGKNITKLMHGVANLDSNEVGKLIKTYKRAGHIGNVFEEYNEEVVNNIGNGIIDAIAEGKNNFTTAEGGVFNLEDNVETFLSVTMPQVFQEIIGLGASGIHSAIQRHRYNQQMQQTIQNNINLFGADRWSAIRSVLDGAKGIEELSRNAVALVDDEEYSPEQKEAIIQYAHDLQAKRAEDLAETKLSDYQYDTDKDYQELSNRTKTNGTITPATTKEGDVVYVKSDEDGSDTAVVYNPETGETTQIPSGDIAETGETLDANDEADKIEQAREIAQTIESGTSATINDNIFTVVDKNPDNGMPIAEVTDANGNLIETREMTNEEVIAMSQQMEAAAQEDAENQSLDPLQKLQKALESNDPKLMEQGVQELSETIAEIEDEPTLDSLEAKVSALGEDVVKKVKPLFDRKRAELSGKEEKQGETPAVSENGTPQTPTGSTPQAPTGTAPTGSTPMGGGQVGETPATPTGETPTGNGGETPTTGVQGQPQTPTGEVGSGTQEGAEGEKEDLVFKVGKAIKDKWKAAKKEVGNKASMTFSGRKLKGHYVLAEADAPTPSHNPLDGFKKSVGFPEDENGKTINDRDYENDKNEQNGVIAISTNYTGEALTNMPVLSRDSGIPYSGNKRTQAGILAAQNGTDTEYIESLKDNLENYGFDEEDLAKFTHPRVFFVLDEELPYDTETFALFNKPAEYAQGRSAMMVKLGKILDGTLFNQMMAAIGSHETISEVWGDKKTVNTLISALQNGGILTQAEYARFVDNNEITEDGKELIVNALIGKVLEGKEEAVRAINDPDTKQLATSVITALPQIAANKQLGDASLMDYISDAIILAHDARKNGVSGNMPITTHLRQKDIAFEGEVKEPSAPVIAIGTFIHSNKTSYLRDFLKKYNEHLSKNTVNDIPLFEDITIDERITLWLVGRIDELIGNLKKGDNQGKETKQFISTLEQVKQLLLNTNNDGERAGQEEPESGEHRPDTGGSQKGAENKPEGSNEVGSGSTGNGEHGVRRGNEGGQAVGKPTGEKPATPTKPSKPSKTPTTHAEAVAHFNAMYGEGTPKAKSAIRIWELTHKGNKPSVKPDGKSIGLDKSENVTNAVELTDEEISELKTLGVQLGKDFIESGDVKFADFFNTMVMNFGDGIRPFTKFIYNGNRGEVSEDIEDQMDDSKAVRAFDINTPLREGTEEVETINEEGNESSNLQESEGDNAPGNLVGGESEGEDNGNGDSGTGLGTNTGTGNGEVVSGNDNGTEKPTAGSGSGESVGQREKGTSNGSGSVRSGRVGNRGNRGHSSNGGVRTTGGNQGSNVPVKESGNTRELTDEEKAKQAEEKAYNEAVEAYSKETNIDVLKNLREGFKKGIQTEEDFLKKAELQGKYRAATERIKDLLKEQPKANVDITQEKVPYVPVSDPEGTHAIGSVVPSGALAYLNDAITKLEEKVGKSVDEFVKEELGYDSLDDMYSDYANNKTDGLASEQVDSVGLAIQAMKEKRCFIIGDMTGVGKGRQAASIIRWGVRNKKKVIFVTEKPDLFTSMYEDLKDIGTKNLTPFIVNNDADANITETVEGQYVDVEVEDADGNITIEKRPKKKVIVRHASSKIQNELYNSDTDELPAINGKGEKKYDFVMMTYSQTSSKTASAQKKLEWLKNYAKDAIIVLDEAHNASGESNTGQFFQDVVQNCEGVTFLSATYAKRPENMALYALRSSMSQINMTKDDLINAISEYGIPMQEILAGALFQSGEMVRRERDFSDVKTHWMTPNEMYDEKEIENLQKTSDMTSNLLREMIGFQRDNLNPIIDNLNAEFEKQNAVARLVHNPIKIAKYTPYSGQVSNIFGMMMYGMKARKTAEMAIQQIREGGEDKKGQKPVIAVENTLGAYIDALPDGEIDGADFSQVFDRGLDGLTKYSINMYTWDENAKNGRGAYVLSFKQEIDAAKEDGVSTAIIEAKINEYKNDENRIPLSLSPIDQIKQMIADAGYKCGEITGRKNALQFNKNGTVTKVPRRTDKKTEMALFNNGGSDAIILNVAGATGISLHSSKRFDDQRQRTMLILQPAKNVNTEVQMRGRIDRTGQVHRGEYFYVTSPIPAEQKIIMMLKQKLASLDANSVGTEDVSSNKVDTQDMDNKYGDEVAKQFLIENMNINSQLDNGLSWNKKLRMWEGHEGLLYDIFIGIQRMDCATQEFVINELSQRYAEQIEYLNQSGINDLKTATMKLDASTIDEAVMIKGKDDESSNYFAHDTKIERVEANVLKKPLRSEAILKKMKQLGVYGEGDTINDDYGTTVIYEQVVAAADKIIDDFKAKQEEALKKFKEGLPNKYKWNVTMLTPEQLEEKIITSVPYVQFTEKQAAELSRKQTEIYDMRNAVYHALSNLKPGMPYFVPLTDNVGNDAPMMYGRFIGFETGDYKPRNIKAVFAVKDSRSQITIPVISQKEAIKKIIDDSRYEMIFQDLMRGENRNSWDYKEPSSDEKLARVDEWWDKMIPKGETNRQIRYMITGNVLQACGALGKHKGQIVSFTRLDKETGEVVIDKGMLLAEDFDPENFRIKKKITKEDVWSNYMEHKDDDHFISVHRSGDQMVVKFLKQPNKKLSEHPAKTDEELMKLIEYFDARRDELRAYVDEKNVEEVLNLLYDKYSFTADELFVMPDSTEKPDAIVPTNKPYREVIDSLSDKYSCYGEYDCRGKLKKMLKQYKMDVNNEDLKNQIKEVSQLYQAYLREKYTKEESVHLAWEAIIYDERAKQALANDDKDDREKCMRIREAIIEELNYRGFSGHEMHFKQGDWDKKEFVDTFNKLNSNPDNAKRFEKIWDIISKLDMNIILSEKITNDTGGQAAGKVVEYNWKYMNAKYISDQAKADTILHEITHTVTAYAIWAVKHGYDHLLSADMLQDVSDLKSILGIIKNKEAFKHDSADGKYTDYGVTNEQELLAEISSNESFRNDLKKVNLIVGSRYGKVAFYEDTPQNAGMAGTSKVNAYDAVMEVLDRMIAGYNQKAWEEVYKGSQYGGYAYSRFADQMRKEGKGEQAIKDATNPQAITLLPGEPFSHYVRRVAEAFKGNEKLRVAHLDTAIETLKAKNDPEAEIKGSVMKFLFGQLDGKANLPMWFETQASARKAKGEFSRIGTTGLLNNWNSVGSISKLTTLGVAKVMKSLNIEPEKIKKQTGWEFDEDNKWKYEFGDLSSDLFKLPYKNIVELSKIADGSVEVNPELTKFARILLDSIQGKQIATLRDIVTDNDTAKEMFAMYPAMKNIPVRFDLSPNATSHIEIENDAKKIKELVLALDSAKEATLAHELQHTIQSYEGFARGTSEQFIRDRAIATNDRLTLSWDKIERGWQDIVRAAKAEGRSIKVDDINEYAKTVFADESLDHLAERLFEGIFKYSPLGQYLRTAGEVESRRVAERLGWSLEKRRNTLFEDTPDKSISIFNTYGGFEKLVNTYSKIPSRFSLSDGTVYGWAAGDGIHLTMEGINPNTMIHEYGHLWMAAMKESNPALYESLLRLAKGTAAWEDVVNDPNYSNLKTDDEILSEVFCRFSGSQGEQKLIDVTREAIANGVDMKDKAAIAGEYSRLAKKLDRVWEKVMKDVLNQDMNQFDSMAEAADMMLRDILNGNNPNDGGYTPSGKLKKSPNGGNPFFVDKNQYSRGGVATHPMSIANDIYERSVSTLGSEWREAWFDYLRSVRKLQEAVVAQTGNEVRDFENAYLHLQHLSSVNKAEQDKVQSTIVEPLIKAMNDIIKPLIADYKKKGGNYKASSEQAMDDLEKYMIAKHGLERNKVLARRDAKNKTEKEYAAVLRAAEEALRKAKEALAKGTGTQADVDAAEQHLNDVKAQMLIRENNLYSAYRKKDYSGFTETFGEGLTDPTNADLEKEAKDYLNNFESTIDKALIDELWKRINEVNGYTLDKALKSGNISKDLYTTLKNQYQNYVPLRGWDKETAEDVYRYMNEGRDKFQPTQKTAFGRKSRAGKILATMLSMNSAAIIQGNKNLAKQKLLNLIQNNPTKLLSVSKTWYEMDSSGNFNPVYPVDASGNPLTDPDDIDAWEKDMEEKRKQNTATIVHGHLKLGLPIKPWQEEEHQIRVNRNGKEYVIYVNGSPNAAKAISGGLNADAKKAQDIEYFTRPVGQFMARAFTAFNPLFLIRNLEKDAISAAMVNGIKYGSGYSWKFAKNFDKLMPLAAFTARATYKQKDKVDVATRGAFGIYKLIHRYNNGTLDTTNEVEKYFQEFMDNGGHTGYSQLWNVEKYDDVINKAIKKANSKVVAQRAQGVVETIATIVEFMNAGFEDISRFATYMTSRQMGRSILMSVADAKDASTNFNKKGSGAKGNRTARDLYIFMNPAIQGVTRYIYRLCNNDISGKGKDADIKGNQTTRAMVGFASLAAYGALMTAICYYCGVFFTGGDDGDDEEFGKEGLGNDYWKLSTFKRRNTINFPGQFLGEGYITINLTPEEAVPYSIGAIIAEHTLGYGHTDQILPEISSQLSRLVPQLEVSPQKWQTVGDLGAEIWRDIIPSAALPIWEVYDNRDFMGNKIHGYENSLKKGTPRLQTVVHNWIDQTTNGRFGAFGNINNIEHIMNGYFGGIVEFPMLVVNSFEGAFLEEGVNLNETPAKVFWNSTANKWNETSALRNEFDYYKSIVDYFDSRLKAQGHTKQKDQESFVNQLEDDDIDIQYWKAFQRIAPEYNSRKVTDKDAVMRKAVQAWHKIDEESKKKK